MKGCQNIVLENISLIVEKFIHANKGLSLLRMLKNDIILTIYTPNQVPLRIGIISIGWWGQKSMQRNSISYL